MTNYFHLLSTFVIDLNHSTAFYKYFLGTDVKTAIQTDFITAVKHLRQCTWVNCKFGLITVIKTIGAIKIYL